MSSDLKATNESARCWEKISSYIKRADMFYSLFKPQLSTFEGHFCVFLLCFWGDDTVHVPHILVKGILKASYHVHETLWKFSHANIFFLYMRFLLKTILFLSPSSCKHFFYLQTIYFGAKERTGAREGDTHTVFPSRAPVFFRAYYFQAPAKAKALGTKLQIFHDSLVSQFPEEIWAQRRPNQI